MHVAAKFADSIKSASMAKTMGFSKSVFDQAGLKNHPQAIWCAFEASWPQGRTG